MTRKKKEVPTVRDLIVDTITAGGATTESLMAASGCRYASLMSNFAMLRLADNYPIKDVETPVVDNEGNESTELTYRIVDAEEWEAIKAVVEAPKRAVAKTLEERLDLINKRIDRLNKALAACVGRADSDLDSTILQLRAEKVGIELEIAHLEKAELVAKMAA